MFEIKTEQTVELAHAQCRPERHGDELVDAVDISIKWLTSNEALDLIHPGLKTALFTDQSSQDQINLIEETGPTHLRLPDISYPIKCGGEQRGMQAFIDVDGELLALHGCTVKKWAVTPFEGGTVEITFLIQSNEGITRDIAGLLDVNQQRPVGLRLVMPDEAQQGLYGDAAQSVEEDVQVQEEVVDVLERANRRYQDAFGEQQANKGGM